MKAEVEITLALAYEYRAMELKQLIVQGLNIDANDAGQSRDISEYLCRAAANATHGQAMKRADSRLWGPILRTLRKRTPTVVITGDQFAWLYDLVDKFDFPAAQSDWRWTLLEELDRVKRVAEADSTLSADT